MNHQHMCGHFCECQFSGAVDCLGCAIAQLVRVRLDLPPEITNAKIGEGLLWVLGQELLPDPGRTSIRLRMVRQRPGSN